MSGPRRADGRIEGVAAERGAGGRGDAVDLRLFGGGGRHGGCPPSGVGRAQQPGRRHLVSGETDGPGQSLQRVRDTPRRAQPRVRTVIVMEALNDIFDIPGVPFGDCNRPNPGLTAEQLIEGHRALIRAAHARGLRIIGGTVTPFKGNPYNVFTDQGEAVRDALNHWILTSGEYDAVIDFAAVVADPTDPDRLNPR